VNLNSKAFWLHILFLYFRVIKTFVRAWPMIQKYRTVYKYGEAEIVQKKSRFIGQAFYVESENQIQELLPGLRKKHHGANHNCYAFRIEGPTIIERQSDDGEPGGTAGMPILDVLRGEELVNALVVVTRFFKNTLLGTGGLVKAYGSAAKEAVNAAVIVTKELYQEISVISDYGLSGKIEYELMNTGVAVADKIYTEQVTFKVYLPVDEAVAFESRLIDLTGSKVVLQRQSKVYGALIDNKFVLV